MVEKRRFEDVEGKFPAVIDEKRSGERTKDPVIRKIHRRNLQAKLRLAKGLLALGLEPSRVEIVLNIQMHNANGKTKSKEIV
ncbi:hypothetical protein [Desulfosarcina ovata]|uniref:Uncharacterized protein n=2 Tax=Desulfosarcina ovata TaxID=83564 RepID=A0A5K8A6E1_9BACT|nr:hypothetical protein [Desulfosarcina ovata]BBO83076.1 hypothetical protein DSCO28_36420 [Desulfosarcina ovata subsp. sediminis]BBO88016.1 hypothetical protein DSCOOX_11960 [Desulfosarcina ovata subsp. ovata]